MCHDSGENLLESPAACRLGHLAKALTLRTRAILQHCKTRVGAGTYSDASGPAAHPDPIAAMLAALVAMLESPGAQCGAGLSDIASLLASAYLQRAFEPHAIVADVAAVRSILVDQVEQELQSPLNREEKAAIDRGLDFIGERAIEVYFAQHGRRLSADIQAQSRHYAYLSHDLRNNLNALMLTLESLKLRIGSPFDVGEAMLDLDAAQHAITETITGMNHLLNAERGPVAGDCSKRAPVDLHEVASEVARQHTPQAALKGLEIKLEIESGLCLHSDRECLHVVLQNLVGNAIKYSSHGTVVIQGGRKGGGDEKVVLSVVDQGPGIRPEQLPHIFDRYRRGETHGQAGFGLGLAIAAQAADLLGGELEARSVPGAGSTFSLVLPAHQSNSRV